MIQRIQTVGAMFRTEGCLPVWVSAFLVCSLSALPAVAFEDATDQRSSRGGVVTGFVRDAGDASGIPGARVHVQTLPEPFVITAADGSFSLPVALPGTVELAASVPYVSGGSLQYAIGGSDAQAGDVNVEIELLAIPALDNPAYVPPSAQLCATCHSRQENEWDDSSHARSATNAWVLDLFSGTGTAGGAAGYVFRDTHDPGDTGFCATCHAPMADVFDPGNVMLDAVAGDADEGVNCVACHQIDSVDGDANALHHVDSGFGPSATYRFPDDSDFPTELWVFGPLDDVTTGSMAAVEAPFFKEARLCASCHQYNNPFTGAPGQSTFAEWQASPWAVPGPNFRTCQTCHMPQPIGPDDICQQEGIVRPADQVHSHEFVGSTPMQLQDAIRLDAALSVASGRVVVDVEVENVGAGHSFPTGVSIRNGLLVVEAMFRGSPLSQVDGETVPFYGDDDVPGKQPGDYAGFAGKGYARVLEGRINGVGPTVRPVLFIDAETVYADTRLASGALDEQRFEFALPLDAMEGEHVEVAVRLLYRRAYRATVVTKGWEMTPAGLPIEIEVGRQDLAAVIDVSPLGIPMQWPALVVLALALAVISVRRLS